MKSYVVQSIRRRVLQREEERTYWEDDDTVSGCSAAPYKGAFILSLILHHLSSQQLQIHTRNNMLRNTDLGTYASWQEHMQVNFKEQYVTPAADQRAGKGKLVAAVTDKPDPSNRSRCDRCALDDRVGYWTPRCGSYKRGETWWRWGR
jgi:hypothetical protein